MKKHYKPKLDPKADLVGTTPKALVRVLFRRVELPVSVPSWQDRETTITMAHTRAMV